MYLYPSVNVQSLFATFRSTCIGCGNALMKRDLQTNWSQGFVSFAYVYIPDNMPFIFFCHMSEHI